ncbi:hypothetical protein AB4254_08185 [Vibrio breoganii]
MTTYTTLKAITENTVFTSREVWCGGNKYVFTDQDGEAVGLAERDYPHYLREYKDPQTTTNGLKVGGTYKAYRTIEMGTNSVAIHNRAEEVDNNFNDLDNQRIREAQELLKRAEELRDGVKGKKPSYNTIEGEFTRVER